MTQPSLLDAVILEDKPRKRVRQVSRQAYAELRDSGRLSRGQHLVLTALAAIYNARQEWPTRAELAQWMFAKGQIARPDHALIAPRLTELVRGRKQHGTGLYVGGGVIEVLPVRRCRIAGTKAHPWRIREAGSKLITGN